MYKNLIYRIEQTASLNLENADKADVQRSSFTAGMLRAFTEILRGMGHEVESGTWDDNGCDRIGFMEIDGVEPFPKKRTQNAEKKRNESAPFGCPV